MPRREVFAGNTTRLTRECFRHLKNFMGLKIDLQLHDDELQNRIAKLSKP